MRFHLAAALPADMALLERIRLLWNRHQGLGKNRPTAEAGDGIAIRGSGRQVQVDDDVKVLAPVLLTPVVQRIDQQRTRDRASDVARILLHGFVPIERIVTGRLGIVVADVTVEACLIADRSKSGSA